MTFWKTTFAVTLGIFFASVLGLLASPFIFIAWTLFMMQAMR